MSEFTKGPWNYRVRVDRFADGTLSEEKYAVTANMGEDTICEMWVDREEEEANAHLISACPEMYEDLKEITALVFEDKKVTSETIRRCMNALSKAEGKE